MARGDHNGCKNKCRDLEGYKKGNYHWVKNGKKYCSKCAYNITTTLKICPCCGNTYRWKPKYNVANLPVILARQRNVRENNNNNI